MAASSFLLVALSCAFNSRIAASFLIEHTPELNLLREYRSVIAVPALDTSDGSHIDIYVSIV
jgi:hypothetical protein